MWPFEGGTKKETKEIVNLILNKDLDGVTLHGGEPLDQSEGLLEIVKELKKNNKTIILFTGYTKKELNSIQTIIWNLADIVVAGRFQLKKRNILIKKKEENHQLENEKKNMIKL